MTTVASNNYSNAYASKVRRKNFRGFTERIELDLTRHSNYTFNAFAIKDGIIKNGIIYGPKYPNFIISLSYRFNASNRKAAGVSSDSLFEGKEF